MGMLQAFTTWDHRNLSITYRSCIGLGRNLNARRNPLNSKNVPGFPLFELAKKIRKYELGTTHHLIVSLTLHLIINVTDSVQKTTDYCSTVGVNSVG